MGSPHYKPNDLDRQLVRDALASGLTQKDAAMIVGVCEQTMLKHYQRDVDTAKAAMIAAIGGTLMTSALKGNIAAQTFYLKTQGRWSETVKLGGDAENPVVLEHKANLASALKEVIAQLAEQKTGE